MSRRALTLICVVSVVLLLGKPARVVEGLGFNTGMAYRYPWSGAITMTRTQGWGGATSHTGDLYYAVDWDNGSGNWLVRAANGGTIRCDPEGGLQAGLGNYVGVFNSVSNQMAITAHLVNCAFFVPGVSYEGTQGQGLSLAGDTGDATGIHVHFHVILGSNLTGVHTTVTFEMSDKSDFTGTGSNGPSDNLYIGDDGVGGTDNTIRSAYLSIGGGASASWWSVGATYSTGVGPCIFSNNPFVHSWNTLGGTFTVQNYIRYDGRLSGIAKSASGSSAYLIAGANWKLLGTAFRITDVMTNQLGPPASSESGGSVTQQSFARGYVNRYTYRALQDVWINGVRRAAYYFQTFGGECYDVDANGVVSLTDTSGILLYGGTVEGGGPNGHGVTFDPRYDLNRSGAVQPAGRQSHASAARFDMRPLTHQHGTT